ncbi:hypothetical protein [Paenibacillus puerhi]|uniref:hypothetical protein n=1 Tax=Paenibacillus puerhi TaxID=2692622 RepID=UPI001F47C9FC|nr:hypothetical protein [Paenibacillus puerhi]
MNQPWVYIVLFGLLLIVYARLLPRDASPSPRRESPEMMKEVESAMDHFAVELEEQNKAIVQLFTDTKKDYETHSAKLASRVETLEKHNLQLQSELSRVGFMTEQIQKQQSSPSLIAQGVPVEPIGAPVSEVPSKQVPAPQAASGPVSEEGIEEAAGRPEAREKPLKIRQRYAELFLLYDQGKSSDAIAKKLGMNKGEIALILQLAKQEENEDVE